MKNISGQFCLLASLFATLFALVSCEPAPEFTIRDKREVQGKKEVELFLIDNKQGTSPLIEDHPVTKQFSRSIEFAEPGLKNLEEGKVRERIYKSYSVEREAVKICVISVEVPSGKAYEYGLEWAEIFREGVIEEGATDRGKQLGTYRIRMDLNCQTVSLRSLIGP